MEMHVGVFTGAEVENPRAKSLRAEERHEAFVLILGRPHGVVDVGKLHNPSPARCLQTKSSASLPVGLPGSLSPSNPAARRPDRPGFACKACTLRDSLYAFRRRGR